MAETNTINIVHAGNELDIKRINEELKALILSPEGTIPGNRNFGLAGEFLSRPPKRHPVSQPPAGEKGVLWQETTGLTVPV